MARTFGAKDKKPRKVKFKKGDLVRTKKGYIDGLPHAFIEGIFIGPHKIKGISVIRIIKGHYNEFVAGATLIIFTDYLELVKPEKEILPKGVRAHRAEVLRKKYEKTHESKPQKLFTIQITKIYRQAPDWLTISAILAMYFFGIVVGAVLI
ncbi:MAG TPA: hypothetical protein VEA37_11700 [Flavobacterium sp.]|nr:hypothetical protein [Flavobacterium sp.]